MKRSQINQAIAYTIKKLEEKQFPLPPFAYYDVEQWKNLKKDEEEIVDNMLGWDVSDFGYNDFEKIGITIFVFRNGNFNDKKKYPKSYCEKLLFVKDGQILPFHFHWYKSEDIINRGGGDLEITLYKADKNEDFSKEDVHIKIDGRSVAVKAGGKVILKPGQSITLTPYIYHQWQGIKGTGDIFLFEVSTTNDDFVDNRFYEINKRIPEVEEDEPCEKLMFADYKNYVNY